MSSSDPHSGADGPTPESTDSGDGIRDGRRSENAPETALETEDGSSAGRSVQLPRSGILSGDPDLPDRIGQYVVLRVLGEGGMGTVYLALQIEPIERRVAIKVIRRDLGQTSLRARFDAERQALARVNHPGIGQVYEAGDTEDGSPYLVMELIEGPRLSEYCDRKKLTIDERLAIFRQVCEAVHHVHQRGVVHRDLKDENILVAVTAHDARPRPKVIDFGIARALDRSEGSNRLTRHGKFVGTPGYLSPEMIEGPGGDDLRVDVYALGVLLFKLLVGELPFEQGSSSLMSLFRRVVDEDPPRPSQRFSAMPPETLARRAERRGLSPAAWQRRLRGDLDAIVQMAMAKDPEKRYGSAAELANDLDRHLAYEPIRAQRAGWLQRTTKFVRRYRGAVLASALVLLVLAAGLWARSQEAARANREAAAAREVSDFLVALFEVSDPGESLGREITARELLDRGAERIRRDLKEQPLARARLLDTMGTVYERLGVFDSAVEHLEESLELRRRHLGDEHPQTLESFGHLGEAQWSRGRLSEAEPLLRRAVDGWRARDAPRQLAHALGRLGMLYELQGDFERAEPPLREALDILRSEGRPVDLAAAYDDLAVFYVDQQMNDEAGDLFRQALAIREAELGPRHPQVATTLNGLAISVAQGGDMAAAEPLFRRTLDIRRQVLGSDHAQVAQSLNNLASCVRGLDRPSEALTLYREALTIWRSTLGASSRRVGQVLGNIGQLQAETGDVAEAETTLRRAIETYETYYAREAAEDGDHNRTQLTFALDDLADLLRDQDRLDEARLLYRRVYGIRAEDLGADHELTRAAVEDLATVAVESEP